MIQMSKTIKYVVFNRNYKCKIKNNNYKLVKNVKYMIKRETIKYYYTINNIKLSKSLINNLFQVYEVH